VREASCTLDQGFSVFTVIGISHSANTDQAEANVPEQLISRMVAQDIVHILEIVQVQEYHQLTEVFTAPIMRLKTVDQQDLGGIMYSDSHSHLDGYTDEQMATLLAEAKAREVEIVIGVGSDLDRSEATIEVARRFPGITVAVGIHPWWATPADLERGARLRQLLSQKEVAAIGEVGIDLEKNPSTGDVQWPVFEMQLGLARELNMPMLLHCKGAKKEMQDRLRKESSVRGVMHGFAGTAVDAESWMELGLYIGIGMRTLTRNFGPEVQQAIQSIPLDRMLLETDSSVRSYTGEENLQPTTVIEVAERVGRMHGVTGQEVGRLTTANLRAMLKR